MIRRKLLNTAASPSASTFTKMPLATRDAALRRGPCGGGLLGVPYTSGRCSSIATSSIIAMYFGSCWPSSSIVTIQSEPVDVMPASVAGCCPKFRDNHTGRTTGCAAASSRITTSEASSPWSWTRTISSMR